MIVRLYCKSKPTVVVQCTSKAHPKINRKGKLQEMKFSNYTFYRREQLFEHLNIEHGAKLKNPPPHPLLPIYSTKLLTTALCFSPF